MISGLPTGEDKVLWVADEGVALHVEAVELPKTLTRGRNGCLNQT
jgi:hypothetical protein